MSSSCCGEDAPKNPKNHDHDHEEGDDHEHSHEAGEFDLKKEVIPVVVVTALLLMGSIYNQPLHNTPYSFAEYLILIPAYLLSGWNVLTIAGKNILKGRFFDENFLMTIATLGAIAINQLPEAVGVMLFFKVGELFQDYAVGNSRRSIKAVLEVCPDYANLKVNGVVTKTDPNKVKIGDIITVTAG